MTRSSSASTTRRWPRGSARTTASTPTRRRSGFKFIGPRMIETGAMMGAEESGGFGFGMHLPERDGVYADLLLLDLFLTRAGGRPLAGVERDRALPRAGRAVVLPAHRCPRGSRRLPRDEAPAAGRPARADAGEPGRRAGRPDRAPGHQRRLQVLPRRRIVAPRPDVRHGAARPGLHRGHLRRHPRRAASMPASAWCAGRERRRTRPGRDAAGRQAVGPRARSGPTRTATSARSWSSRPAGDCRSRSTRSRTSPSSSCPDASN